MVEALQKPLLTFYNSVPSFNDSGVRSREVELRTLNNTVPSSTYGSQWMSTLGFFIGPNIRRYYRCSSQEAESRDISISCKIFFLNRCEINMFKRNDVSIKRIMKIKLLRP